MRSAKRRCASASETGASAVDTLLFPLDRRLHVLSGAGIFASDFGERRAGELLFLQGRERLAEPQERVGRLGARIVFLAHGKEGVGGIAIALALEHALAEPEMGFARHAVGRVLLKEIAEGLLGECVVLAQHVAVAEVELVLRALRRR